MKVCCKNCHNKFPRLPSLGAYCRSYMSVIVQEKPANNNKLSEENVLQNLNKASQKGAKDIL